MTDIDEKIERDGKEVAIVLDVDWTFDPGEFVEAGHPFNGYGRGLYAEVTARDAKTNESVELTAAEVEAFQEKYPPDDGIDEP